MTRRTLAIALIVSLVVNVFVLGGFAGAALTWRRTAPSRAAMPGRWARLREAAQALSPADRRRLRQAVRAAALELAPTAERARDARQRAQALLIRPAFDRAAFDAALADARNGDIAVRIGFERAVSGVAATLPANERTMLANGLARGR